MRINWIPIAHLSKSLDNHLQVEWEICKLPRTKFQALCQQALHLNLNQSTSMLKTNFQTRVALLLIINKDKVNQVKSGQ